MSVRASSAVVKSHLADQVRGLLAEHIGNPIRRTARSARAEYVKRIFTACLSGDDIDREADEWLATLRELCGPFSHVADIEHWYEREQNRLLKLAGR